MKRTTARELAVQLCFASASSGVPAGEMADRFFDAEHYPSLGGVDKLYAEMPGKKQMAYIRRLCQLTEEKRPEIDALISKYAKGWRLERISRTALAVLRCAVCEILYLEDVPASSAIDEAVELDKGYDTAETVAFVNGVLGGIMRGEFAAPPEESRE